MTDVMSIKKWSGEWNLDLHLMFEIKYYKDTINVKTNKLKLEDNRYSLTQHCKLSENF